jgi:DHA1 family tetracycline resistance protein-like MFS transporter
MGRSLPSGCRSRVVRRQESEAAALNAGVRGSKERLPRDIRVLVGAAFVIAIGYGIVAPAVPVFARSFDVGVTAASAVVSAFAVMRLAFAPFSGRMLGRMGELPVFCGGLLIVGLSSAACAFAADYGQLLAFRAVGGVGSTMFTVSAASLLIRISPPRMRGRASGAWATGFLLGNIAGPVVGGALAAVSLRAPFLVYACILFGVLASAGLVLRGRPTAGGEPERATPELLTFTAALRQPAFRAALTANFVNGWTVYGVRIALVPLFVVEVLGQPSSWAGPALAAFATGTAATLLIGGKVADRRGRRMPILVGSAIVAVTSLWLGFSTTLSGLLAASLLSGAGTGLMSPPVNAAVGDVVAAKGRHVDGGRTLAGFQMVGDVGAISGPVLAGMVAETTGYAAAFAVTAAIAAVAFMSWLYAPETLPP